MNIRMAWPQNLSVTLNKIDVLGYELGVSAKAVVKAMAEQILWDSDNIPPMVPVDTAALQSTGRVEKVTGGWAVMYGGDGVDYANQVHDDLRPRVYKRAGSGPKFIETHYINRTESSGPDFDKSFQELAKRLFGE